MTPEKAFDQYHQAVYRFAYRMTRSGPLAEDITQECFLALVRAPGRFDEHRGTIKTYLFSIARHLALKQYRDHSLESPLDADPPVCPALEIASAVAQAVGALPLLQREAIVLFQYEGLTLEEIAGVVGADIGTVKSRLHRAREALKRRLAPYRKAGNIHGTA